MKSSFKLFKIAGIDIGIHYSWFIIFLLITWLLAQDYFPQGYPNWPAVVYWITAAISALMLFLSVLIHEMAHSLVAKSRHLPVSSITLFIFGGVSNLQQEPEKPSIEFIVAIAGPLSSVVLAAMFWGLSLALPSGTPAAAGLGYLAFINILLAAFNILPGFPLDGGRVLRSIIWGATGNLKKATSIASITGQVFGWGLIVFGAFSLFTGDFLGGLWIAFIGWFLASAAGASRRELTMNEYFAGTKVRDVMNSSPVIVTPNTPVNQVINDVFYQGHGRAAPVIDGEKIEGIITITDVKKLPNDKWLTTPVKAVMTKDNIYSAGPEDNLNMALQSITRYDVNQLLILDNGKLVGILSRQDILRYIQLGQELRTKN
jgi:Zn-dependent protease/predicted transcriptional regulator